jgi:ATP-dependent 26S proteasome regulatory subunit
MDETKVGKRQSIERMLTDSSVPLRVRIDLTAQACRQLQEEGRPVDRRLAEKILTRLLEAAAETRSDEQVLAKSEELGALLKQLQQGPLRYATFDQIVESGALGRRAQVILPDGGWAFCALPNAKLADELRCGDTLWLDSQGSTVIDYMPQPAMLGEEATLERRLPGGDVEVKIGEIARYVCRPTAQLRDQLANGEARPGSTLIVCPRRLLAWRALPQEDGWDHLGFLSREPVPDIRVERDVGSPPAFIRELSEHVRRELVSPEIGRRYRLRRSKTLIATGVPGSGKTLAILALHRRLYEIMSELTGIPLLDLPQRVFKLSAAEVLSKWLGESDARITRFFEEVEQLASTPFVAPDGRSWQLPVLVICEEIDSLARQRGEDGIHDRIQSSLLAALDPVRPLFRDQLVIVVCTSNIPSAIDVAFARRAGGTMTRFGRLTRRSFRKVLETQLRGRPFVGEEAGRQQAVSELTSWLFSPNGGDVGQVELTYVGQPSGVTRHRRDFLTGGLLDRATQQASDRACDAEYQGTELPGLTTESLMSAIDTQVRNIVDLLTPGNCEQYLTLPDAVRVGTVRRLEQPAALPLLLERAS